MNPILAGRIERAKYLLHNVHHIGMATVNADGSPHNTPLMFFFDDTLTHIYWSSHPDAQHSQNVTRTGRAFFALYEGTVGGGLFITASDTKELDRQGLDDALTILNTRRTNDKKPPIPLTHFVADGPQRLYSAELTNFYINYSERNANGLFVRDFRHEISAKDLLS